MLSLKITDLKALTSLIFTQNTFDQFLCYSVLLRSRFELSIDGRSDEGLASWENVRPTAYAAIKGSRLPESFRIVLVTKEETAARFAEKAGFKECPVSSLSLNFHYQAETLTVTTGISLKAFTPDKTVEKAWDESVKTFFTSHGIGFEAYD